MGRNKMDEKARVGGGTTAYEAMLERKRAALRRALKSEYIKKIYNPKMYNKDGYVEMHDAALMRYHAMQKTVPEYWSPSWRSFMLFGAVTLVPLLDIITFIGTKKQILKENVVAVNMLTTIRQDPQDGGLLFKNCIEIFRYLVNE